MSFLSDTFNTLFTTKRPEQYNEYLQSSGTQPIERVLNSQEQAYFNIPSISSSAAAKYYGSGVNDIDKQSNEKRAARGARLVQEARLNALREKARALGLNIEGNFDPKNLSNPNNTAIGEGLGDIYGTELPFLDRMRALQAKKSSGQGLTMEEAIEFNRMKTAYEQMLVMQQDSSEALRELDLGLMTDRASLPDFLNQSYTSAAKNAGTYSDTDQFGAGLQSEVDAGLVGANAVLDADQQSVDSAQLNQLRDEPRPMLLGTPEEQQAFLQAQLNGQSLWEWRLNPTEPTTTTPSSTSTMAPITNTLWTAPTTTSTASSPTTPTSTTSTSAPATTTSTFGWGGGNTSNATTAAPSTSYQPWLGTINQTSSTPAPSSTAPGSPPLTAPTQPEPQSTVAKPGVGRKPSDVGGGGGGYTPDREPSGNNLVSGTKVGANKNRLSALRQRRTV